LTISNGLTSLMLSSISMIQPRSTGTWTYLSNSQNMWEKMLPISKRLLEFCFGNRRDAVKFVARSIRASLIDAHNARKRITAAVSISERIGQIIVRNVSIWKTTRVFVSWKVVDTGDSFW
jgi:hypothetical protein